MKSKHFQYDIVSIRVRLEEFIPWVLQFGADAEVLDLSQARETVQQCLLQAMSVYEG